MAIPDLDGRSPAGNSHATIVRRFGVFCGVLSGLLAGVVVDHRLGAMEQRLDEVSGHVICKLPPPATAALRRAEKPYAFQDI